MAPGDMHFWEIESFLKVSATEGRIKQLHDRATQCSGPVSDAVLAAYTEFENSGDDGERRFRETMERLYASRNA